jgi:HSP20 family protein
MTASATQKIETALEPQRAAMPENYLTPDVDIRETKNEYVLEADMPGVDKEGLDITLEGHALTIIGHRNSAAIPGEALYRESQPCDYRRVFELDPAIDSGKISAKIERGVLLVTLPKAEKVKPRKITVGE